MSCGTLDAVRGRVESIDLWRGFVMVVMALDHARDFFTDSQFDPTDASQTTVALFATRWITHLCAPVFVLLAGAGARLSLGRGRSRGELARFLVTRGLWLVFLELTVINVAWIGLDFEPTHYRFLVISTLGFSMIAAAGLIYLPMRAIVAFGIVMVAGHDLLDSIDPADLGPLSWLWNVLHMPGLLGTWERGHWALFVLYPLIPWIGVMALGYAFGALVETPALRDDPARRTRLWLVAAAAMIVAFVAIRATAGHLHRLAARGRRTLRAVPVVRRREVSSTRLVARLLVRPRLTGPETRVNQPHLFPGVVAQLGER